MSIISEISEQRNNKNSTEADYFSLTAEWASALMAMTPADIRELEKFGVTSPCAKYGLVGITKIIRWPDSNLYEPHPSGITAFVTPVRVEDWRTPEATDDYFAVRCGDLVDLIAWDPRTPLDWSLRTGEAEWLGAVAPQYCNPQRVRFRQSPLDWLRGDCTGLVPVSNDVTRIYHLLMEFAQAGIYVKTEEHAIALRRIAERPWPVPEILVEPA